MANESRYVGKPMPRETYRLREREHNKHANQKIRTTKNAKQTKQEEFRYEAVQTRTSKSSNYLPQIVTQR